MCAWWEPILQPHSLKNNVPDSYAMRARSRNGISISLINNIASSILYCRVCYFLTEGIAGFETHDFPNMWSIFFRLYTFNKQFIQVFASNQRFSTESFETKQTFSAQLATLLIIDEFLIENVHKISHRSIIVSPDCYFHTTIKVCWFNVFEINNKRVKEFKN